MAITERQLQRCDEIFAVARSGRAGSDEGVASVLRFAMRQNISNVGIICTASEVSWSSDPQFTAPPNTVDDRPLKRPRLSKIGQAQPKEASRSSSLPFLSYGIEQSKPKWMWTATRTQRPFSLRHCQFTSHLMISVPHD